MQGTQINKFPIENLFISRTSSMPTVIVDMKPLLLLKYEFECREKLSLKMFSPEVLGYQDSDPRKKTILKSKSCLQVLCFRLRRWWRKWNWRWLRINSWDIERNQYKQHFLEFLDCHESAQWIKTEGILSETSSTDGKCSIEFLLAGIKTLVLEKYEFDYRSRTIIVNVY